MGVTYPVPHKFTRSNGSTYEVIGTRIEGDRTIDTLKSALTGKFKELDRIETIKFMKG